MAGEMKLAAFGHSFQIQLAGEFVVQSKVAKMRFAADHGRSRRSEGLQSEIAAALNAQAPKLNPRDAGQVKVLARQINIENASRRIIGGSSRDDCESS